MTVEAVRRKYLFLSEEGELRTLAKGRHIRFVDIVRIVADESGNEPGVLLGPRRTRDIAWARHLVMLVARDECPWLSFPHIGRMINRDHTTVMSGCKAAERRIGQFDHYRRLYEAILRRVRALK